MAPMRSAALLAIATMSQAANYTAELIQVEGNDVVRLHDHANATEVLIAPHIGNNAYSMKVKGQNILWSPYSTLSEWKQKPVMIGNPFLHPWANRIEGDSYFANGRKYTLNGNLENFRRDANRYPIHGLAVYAKPWRVVSVEGGDREAMTASRLEFWRHPEWMAQFPFAHNVEMIHRLRDGVLEVETVIENLSSQPMPVSTGFHTYYQLTDSPRDDWKVTIAARDRVTLSAALTPTGETTPFKDSGPVTLKGGQLDDVFTNLIRDSAGRAVFSVQGRTQKVSVEYGPNYPVSVVYAPPGRNFICFEPMAGVTNGFNLGHAGKFPLQSIPVSGEWRESFWIRPSGF